MANFKQFTQTVNIKDQDDEKPEVEDYGVNLTTSRTAAVKKVKILMKYQDIFGADVHIANLAIQPILLARPYLMSRIEAVYDNLVERVLKTRLLTSLNMVKALQDTLREKFNESLNYYHQALANVIYSIDKYRDSPEVKIFEELLRDRKLDQNKLLFYIYLRQHYKVITYVNFVSLKKTEKDATKIQCTYRLCQDVLDIAFNFDPVTQRKLSDALKIRHGKKSFVGYYEFLSSIFAIKLIYKDMPLLDRFISLYAQKSKEEVEKELPAPGSQANTQRRMTSTLKRSTIRPGEPEFDPLNEDEYSFDGTKVEEGDRFIKKSSAKGTFANIKITDLILDPKERKIFVMVRDEILSFTTRLVSAYSKKYRISADLIEQKFDGANHQIYKKINNIIGSIFLADRRKFFALLRIENLNDAEIMGYWEAMQDKVEELKHFPVMNKNLAKEFLVQLFQIRLISDEIEFFLRFHFENDDEILDTFVDVEGLV